MRGEKMNSVVRCAVALVASLVMMTGCGRAPALASEEDSTPQTTSGVTSEIIPAGDPSGEAVANKSEETQAVSSVEADNENSVPEKPVTSETSNPIAEETEMSEDVKYIALTFDDGPNTTTTSDVLDKLEKYDVVASFFLVGNNINDGSAEVVKRAHDMGCEINNHSRSHSDMTTLSAEEIKAEYDYVDEKVFEITGEHTGFFRPPYIAVSEDMFTNIDAPFIAGIGANDWEDKVTAERRAALILRQAKDGDIILLHDMEGNSQTVEALDTIIPELKSQGYKFVTVSELFKIKGIDPDMEKVYTNVTQQYMYN